MNALTDFAPSHRQRRRVRPQRHVGRRRRLRGRVVESHRGAQVLQETGQTCCEEAGCHLW